MIDNNFLIYETNDAVKVEVTLKNENIWLTQEQISKLYNKAKSTINEHIKNIYAEQELKEENSELPNFLQNQPIFIILR